MRKLNNHQLANLFIQLQKMECAGLPAFKSFEIVQKSDAKLKKPIKLMQHYLNTGKPISEAGYKAGIFIPTHRTLIHAAECSGTLATVYGQLGAYYARLSERNEKMKSRLYLPVFVLIIALFMQPMPALVKSEITGVDYLFMTVGRLVAIGIGVYVLIQLPRIFQRIGLVAIYDNVLMWLPVISAWIVKRQVNEFYFILALMLDAGVAFVEALPKAVATIKNKRLRQSFQTALAASGRGDSVTETLSKVSILDRNALQIINSSEYSGQLARGLLRFAQIEAENISLQDEALAEWLPRLVYITVCIWMAYSLVGSKLGSLIPSNL